MSTTNTGSHGAVRFEQPFPTDFFQLHSKPLRLNDPNEAADGSTTQAARRVRRARKQAIEETENASQWLSEIEAILSAPQPYSAPSRQALTRIIAEGAHVTSDDPAEAAAQMLHGMIRDAGQSEEYRRIAEQMHAGDHHSVIEYFLDQGLCLEQARLNARQELRMRARPSVRALVRRLNDSAELLARAHRAAMRLLEARESLKLEAEPQYRDRIVTGPQYTQEYLEARTWTSFRLIYDVHELNDAQAQAMVLDCDSPENQLEQIEERSAEVTKKRRVGRGQQRDLASSQENYRALARTRPFNPFVDPPELVWEQLLWKGKDWAVQAGWRRDDPTCDVIAAEFGYYVQGRLTAPGRRQDKKTGNMELAVLRNPSWVWLKSKWRAFIAEYRATEDLCKHYTPLEALLVANEDTGSTVKEASLASLDPMERAEAVDAAKARYKALRASLPQRQRSQLDEMFLAVAADDSFDPSDRSALARAMGCPRTTLNSRLAKITAEFHKRGAKQVTCLELDENHGIDDGYVGGIEVLA